MSQKNTEFSVFEVKVDVQVVRKTGRYDSDTLANITANEEFPLSMDVTLDGLIEAVGTRIIEVRRRVSNVLEARGEFERKVLLALEPPTIDPDYPDGVFQQEGYAGE